MVFKRYQEVEERILLQENLESELYKIYLSPDDLELAEKELKEQRFVTLEILEKTVWMEKSWLERVALQIMGKKYSFLETILHDSAYRSHEVCKAPLRRYDLYEKQVQIGYDLQEIYGALRKFVGRIEKYQQEWKKKRQDLLFSSEQLRRMEQIETATEKKEEILTSLQNYLQQYLSLKEEQKKKICYALESLVGEAKAEAYHLPLEEALLRNTLVQIAEELKITSRKEKHRLQDQAEVFRDERDRLTERLETISASSQDIHLEFKRMKRQGYALQHDFQTLKMAKTGELLDPQIIEHIKTAEKHHQETLELLKKDDEVQHSAVQDIQRSHEDSIYEEKVEALLREEKS